MKLPLAVLFNICTLAILVWPGCEGSSIKGYKGFSRTFLTEEISTVRETDDAVESQKETTTAVSIGEEVESGNSGFENEGGSGSAGSAMEDATVKPTSAPSSISEDDGKDSETTPKGASDENSDSSDSNSNNSQASDENDASSDSSSSESSKEDEGSSSSEESSSSDERSNKSKQNSSAKGKDGLQKISKFYKQQKPTKNHP